jgi:agmatinase
MERKERINLPHVGIASFGRFPICEDLDALDADIAILGFPFDEGSNYRSGSRMAPRKIRDVSLRFSYPRGGTTGYFDVETGRTILEHEIRNRRIWDCGDVDIVYTKPMETYRNATEDVATILGKGALPVVFGGDHSISFPVIRAYGNAPMDLVMVDGHLDFTDHTLGVTHANGMPFRRASELPNVRKIVQLGIRGIRNSRQYYDDAKKRGNYVYTAREIRRRGIAACLEEVGELQDVYYSIDVDGIDPSVAPGCSGTEPGGLNYFELLDSFEYVCEKACVVGFDVAEVNPYLDVADMTSSLAAMLALQFLGFATASPHWKRRKLIPRTP